MTAITISAGNKRIGLSLPTHPDWKPEWFPSDDSLDIGLYSRLQGQFAEYEMRTGNTSIVVGDKSKTKAVFEAAVSVHAAAGYSIAWDCERSFPWKWFPMRECVRRFVVYPSDRALAAEAQNRAALLQDVTWVAGCQRYGPCDMRMAMLPQATKTAVHSNLTFWLDGLRGALKHGTTFHLEDTEDGPIQPGAYDWRWHGPKDRGAPAGSGIYFDTGWQDDPLCAPVFWLQAACAHERRWHVYHRATGLPVSADDYPDGVIKYQEGTGDPNNGWLPELNPTPVDPLPLPYDSAHAIRGFRHALALTEMTDSPMARHMIASQAAHFRLQYGDRGAYANQYYFPPLVRNYTQFYKGKSKQGGGIEGGRILGWLFFLWAQDVKVNGTEGSKKACLAALDYLNTVAPRSGICQRVTHNPGNDIWYDPNWDLAHSFEQPILWTGGKGCAIQTGEPVPDGMQRACQSLLTDVRKGTYYSGDIGPMDYLYVAHRGGSSVYPLVDGKPGSDQVIGDPTHQEHFAALCGKPELSLGVGTPAPDLHAKRAQLEARTNLYGKSHLLALLQGIA